MAVVLGLVTGAIWWLISGRATAPVVAVVAQIPAFATVALITQYSTLTWFVAGLAVFSQSVHTRAADDPARPRGKASTAVTEPADSSPEMVGSRS
jgi:hypothetical protein